MKTIKLFVIAALISALLFGCSTGIQQPPTGGVKPLPSEKLPGKEPQEQPQEQPQEEQEKPQDQSQQNQDQDQGQKK